MKKRVIAVLLGAFLAFNTFGDLMVTAAGESAEDENEKLELVLEEEPEVDKVTEEVTESEIEDEVVADKPESEDYDLASILATSLAADTGYKELTSEDFIKSVGIFRVNGDVETPLADNGVISKDDTIRVKYEFNPITVTPENGMKFLSTDYVLSGKSYSIPGIPKNCVRADDESISVTNGNRKLGDITFDGDGKATLTIANTFTEAEEVKNAYAGFDLKLNLDGNAEGQKSSYELAFGNQTFTVKVDEFMAKAPTVEKTASEPDAEGVITWTVTLKNNANPIQYANGYTFTDSFSEGQEYVDGSFKLLGNEANPLTATYDGKYLSWTYTDNKANAEMKFQYQTKVDIIALTKDATASTTVNKDVSNKVSVTSDGVGDYDALNISSTASKSISKEVKQWIAKEGGEVDSNGEASWTVTIQNNGFELKDVVLTDKVIADADVKITIKNVKVVDQDDKAVANTYNYTNNTQTFAFTENMKGNATYTVTYDTKIEDFSNYIKKNHSVPKNEAYLTYKYLNGKGEPVDVEAPTVGKDFTNKDGLITAKAAIEKQAVPSALDTKEHTLTWKVIANSSKQDLKAVKVIDIIPKGNSFVSISDIKIGDTEGKCTTDTSEDGSVTFDFGNIGANVLTFTVVTKLDVSQNSIWASNASKDYTNEVTLQSEGNTDVSDSATQTYTSEVIKKTAGKYNYADRTIQYTIVVNSNNMSMTNVVVKDALDERLEYVNSDVKPTIDNNVLTFNLGNIQEKRTITYTVKVKDGETFQNTGKVTIQNKASLASDQYKEETVTPAATTEFTNTVIAKAGKRNGEIIDYTVSLNPAQQKLYKEGIEEVVIQDTLGGSLVLDEDSVHLYEATVGATDGALSKDTEISNIAKRVDSQDGKTVLQVVVPKDYDEKAFVLEYRAYMLNQKANDYTNNVVLKGYGAEEKNNANVSYQQSDFSNVDFSKYTYYISELRDEYDKTIVLKNGHFVLLDPAKANKVVAETDIDSDGEIVFKGLLEPNHEYKVKQTSTEEGYIIPDEYKEGKLVKTTDKGLSNALAQKENNVLYNAKPAKKISIKKEDGHEVAVSGATLKITWKDSTGAEQTADSWTTDGGHSFDASYDIEYTLTETKTPFGYYSAEPISFKVVDGTLLVKEADNWVSKEAITMIDTKKGEAGISVKLVSAVTGDGLEGGQFVISENSDGSNTISSWKTDGGFKEITLPDGEYYIVEKNAPTGYKAAAPKQITIKNGTVEEPQVIVENTVDASKPAKLILSPETLGITPDMFKAMKIALFTFNPETKELEKVEPTAVDEEAGKQSYDINYQQEYEIQQTADVPGFKVIEPIKIKVVAKDDSTSLPESSDEPAADPEGTTTPASTDVIKIKNPEGAYIPKTVAELGKTITPQPVPVVVNNNGGEPEHHHYYGPAKPVAKDELKDKEITALANTDAAASNGGRLAKTGGFLGTLTGYLAAALLMIVGAYLVFGNRKRVK